MCSNPETIAFETNSLWKKILNYKKISSFEMPELTAER